MPVDQTGYWVPPDTVYPPELHTPHPEGYLYPNTIPDATTQTPEAILNKFYGDRANVRDWTDPNGVLRRQQETHRDFPQYAVRPIGSSGLVGRWPRPDGLRAVPVRVYGMRHVSRGREVVVEFINRDRRCPSMGISMGDIIEGNWETLEGADDIVLDNIRAKQLTFIITWLGYPVELSIIHTRHENRPLRRFELAQQIAVAYARFFKRVEEKCVLPIQVGFFNIALHQGKNSKDDSLGVQLLQLHLVKFRNATHGYWYAEMDIV